VNRSRPRPRLKDVAARAGVAASTASLILRGEGSFASPTIGRVREAAAQLGYPTRARMLDSGQRTGIAGVVIFRRMGLTLRDQHTQDVLRGLHAGVAAHGKALMVMPPVDDPRAEELYADRPIDVAFFLPTFLDISRVCGVLAERGVPCAYLESGGRDAPESMVAVDDLAPMADLAHHLRELGHERFAVVTLRFTTMARRGPVATCDPDSIENHTNRTRMTGLVRAGITPSYVYEARESSVEEGLRAAAMLTRLAHPPTAIVCQTDAIAGGVLVGLKNAGIRVPEQMSVTGFDGVTMPSLAPHRLTTVLQDGVLKGLMLAEAGMTLLEGSEPERTLLPQYFVVGNTTGPARAEVGLAT
jgi:DNA-binding LacI/PurR family transcriptional regulator